MKNNIKTNLKLAGACATAMMTLSGCFRHENVIENIGSNKIVLRDVIDDKERIVEFVGKPDFKYSHVGDTVALLATPGMYNKYRCFRNESQGTLIFNWKLIHARQEQAKLDSLKFVIAREHVGKQR